MPTMECLPGSTAPAPGNRNYPASGSDPTDDYYFPLHDRLGNITGYRKAVANTPAAQLDAVFEYDAFGRELFASGPAADKLPFRFSSKFTDAESGLSYYGYRYYDARWGRSLSRDSINEKGGLNLYSFLKNNGVGKWDYLGQCPQGDQDDTGNGNSQEGGSCCIEFKSQWQAGGYKSLSDCIGNHPARCYSITSNPNNDISVPGVGIEGTSGLVATGLAGLGYTGAAAIAAIPATVIGSYDFGNWLYRAADCNSCTCTRPGRWQLLVNHDYGYDYPTNVTPRVCMPE